MKANYERQYMVNTKGKFMTHVNEIYLREEVSCGQAEFDEHQNKKNILSLADDEVSRTLTFFDTETLSSQIDLIENCSMLRNIVLFQSSLKKLKNKHKKIFTKLKHLVELDPNKNIYIFPNEYCKETASEINQREVPEADFICKTLQWYKNTITVDWINFLLISNDFEVNKQAKKLGGVKVQTIKEFAIENFKSQPHLQNFIGIDSFDESNFKLSSTSEGYFDYAEYLDEEEVNSGIRTGQLIRSKISVNRNNIFEVTARTRYGFDIKIFGAENLNRAIHGDVAAVELLDESEWLQNQLVAIVDDDDAEVKDGALDTNRTADSETQEFRSLQQRILKKNLCPVGIVRGIIHRDIRNMAGQIIKKVDLGENGIFAEVGAADPRFSNTLLKLSNIDELLNQKIMFSVDGWPQKSKYPLGHLVGIFGKAGDNDTQSKVILFEHSVETRNFSKAVYDCLPKEGKNFKITDAERARREDLRSYPICSVDPPGCKDIDDALHSRVLPNGNIECGVHIADVTHFVKAESAIDKEAAFRSTTVYLVDRRTDMLPSLLTEDLCSLRCKVERLAFSCIWELDPKTAEIINVKFHKSVIESTNAFTYQQAQDLIDDKSKNNKTVKSLRGLMKMAKILKNKRNEKGALTLASTQVKFNFDQETHNPTDVSYYSLLDTNSMVEEFMLLANISVSGKILEHFPSSSILRHHTAPKPQMIKELSNLMETLGYHFDYSSSIELARSLDLATKSDNKFFNKLARIMTTRCMNEAQYICTADFDFPEYKHYGLATQLYTHFTSPIRRYADVLVHRLLAASVDIESLPRSMSNKHNLRKICDNMNMRHRNARFASKASSDYFAFLFFKNKNLQEKAMISGIERNGVAVIIPKYGYEGFIDYSPEEEQENLKLIQDSGKKIVIETALNGQRYKIFDEIDVMMRMEMKHFRKQIIIQVDKGTGAMEQEQSLFQQQQQQQYQQYAALSLNLDSDSDENQ